uniref:No apical meristem-associated C-terminal domain-containing protein n=1 Tax=Tanacetum cinerariifolium TaxID=118510 RepID=A0A699HB90_TANCI|nr:hypothetical protein [Tanacetum cinerariifolium]
MEFEAGYSFSAAPAVAGCSNPTATTKRSKRSTETEVVVTVSGETLREAGDMSLKVDQVTPHFRLIDWVYYCRVARRHVDPNRLKTTPVEEVEPVKPKRKYTRRSKPTKKNDNEFVEPWSIEKEIALCKAFVAKSEDSVEGNGKKAAGFWREVAEHFHEEMGEDKRSYDSVQMPKFYKSKKSSSKKSRTSENTSQGNSDSAHIGVNLNDKAADSDDVEAQEVPAPMGRDRAKKKGSSSGARSETSIAGDPSLVDALLSKFTMAATPFFTQRKESSSEYLRIKERELKLEERKCQENYSFTEQVNSIQQLLAYCLIIGTEVDIGEIIYSDHMTKLLNKSRDKNFGFLHGILSNSNFTKDPYKLTNIELTAHMIDVNNQKDSVSPLPLAAKPKKGKYQTVTPTLPKSQGLEVLGALSKKSVKN